MKIKRYILITLGILATVLTAYLVANQFHNESRVIFSVETKAKAYWQAEYSEYECLPDLIEGGLDCDTEYWDEIISDINFQVTYNGKPEQVLPQAPIRGQYDKKNLDRVVLKKKIETTVIFENGDVLTKQGDYSNLVSKIGQRVNVRYFSNNPLAVIHEDN